MNVTLLIFIVPFFGAGSITQTHSSRVSPVAASTTVREKVELAYAPGVLPGTSPLSGM